MNPEQSKPNIPAGYNTEDTTGVTSDVATEEIDQNTASQNPQYTDTETPDDTTPAPGENVVDRQIDIIARM
ncbi:hypothetical protein [Gloeocapsopsis dulcis]|uniref:Uncharacterized protein n=1 Tax=Gloeocapsopsis dulcis AAB1 = 1H9 TaxID=1433147 RepID=A0A6N8G112_9CHRO|nr:hypothetical protein [Gloeocapsopsis dulcis]MUL39013.1 hypothetical protein [Gloeocapsopsis dulcis AAB1 = 1H9]WNN90845.1 hypothetical protein P0S91_07150 [Gloeocapsopsis dulcis]